MFFRKNGDPRRNTYDDKETAQETCKTWKERLEKSEIQSDFGSQQTREHTPSTEGTSGSVPAGSHLRGLPGLLTGTHSSLVHLDLLFQHPQLWWAAVLGITCELIVLLFPSAPWRAPPHCLLPCIVRGEMLDLENESHKSIPKTWLSDAFLTNENNQLENWKGLWDLEIWHFLPVGLRTVSQLNSYQGFLRDTVSLATDEQAGKSNLEGLCWIPYISRLRH